MSETRGKENNHHITRAGGYPTLGLLTARVSDELGATFWNGVLDAAREHGANLLAFAGGILRSPHGFDAQANVLYDLVGIENVDGLVIDGGLLSHYIGLEALEDFCGRYRDLPQVVVEVTPKGIPSVLVDFYQGMRAVIAHLIEIHGYRRIGFIRGPEESATGEDRYQAYVDALAEHGLPLEPDLVVPGTFFVPSGAEAVRLLLDERQMDLDALAAANDFMALDAMQALQARGIRVPGDIAVVGFDDWKVARVVTPPLTTARLHNYQRARRAAEMLLAQLQGEEVPEQAIIPSELVVRQSCGCPNPAVAQAAVGPIVPTGKPFEAALTAQRQHILSDMTEALEAPFASMAPAWGERLLDTFTLELAGQAAGSFLSELTQILRQVVAADEDVVAWNGVISTLRRHALPYLDGDQVSQAGDLWNQARMMIGETAQRAQAYQVLQTQEQAQTWQDIGQALVTTFSLEELTELIARELPRLNIPGCYLSLYDGRETLTEESRLILACHENEQIDIEPGGWRFPSRQLASQGMLPQDRLYSMVVEPLYLGEEQLGFVLFEVGHQAVTVCDTLRGLIGSALKGALLVRQLENRAVQLRTAAEVSHIASSILDPRELMQQIVELVRERFDLYYVGLFVKQEGGPVDHFQRGWAVLRAGTGEAGQEMLKQGHRLRVGGNSMIGQCIATGEACIAQDVGKETVHAANPLLPETRSELALPLMSRGETIGALTIQSVRRAAFSQEDIAVFQTMAGQLANALENARLFRQSEEALEEVKAVQRRYIREGWDRYLGKQ